MKCRHLLIIIVFFALISCVNAEKFTPNEGIFAFREVEIHEINGINFTVPTDYSLTHQGDTEMDFAHGDDILNISVVKDGKVDKVKSDKSKNITSSKTMLGHVNGYLVDNNGTYTFSYRDGQKLVVIASGDMSVMIGAIETGDI